MFLKKWEDWLVCAFLFYFTFVYPSNPDLLHSQARYGLLAATSFFAFLVGRELRSRIAGYATAYFLFSAISVATSLEYTPKWAKYAALESLVWFASIVAVVMLFDRKKLDRLLDLLALLCLGSSLVMVGAKIMGQDPYAILNNSAADACLIAVLYPILVARHWIPGTLNERLTGALSFVFILLPIAAIAVSGSSTAFVAFAFMLLTLAALYRNRVTRTEVAFCSIGLVVIGAGLYAFSPDVPFGDSGRYTSWKASYNFANQSMEQETLERYKNNTAPEVTLYLDRTGNTLTGLGSGSFRPLATGVQIAALPQRPKIFPFAHNDPLQIFFEQGWLGVIFATLVLLVGLTRALDRPYLFAALSTYAAISFVQFPLRYYGSAFVGAVLLREAFSLEGKAWKSSVVYLREGRLLETLRLRAVLLLAGMFSPRAKIWRK